MKIKLPLIIFVILFYACKKEKKSIDVSSIHVNVSVDRFEKKFYTANENNLADIKTQYSYLFPFNTHDSIWIAKINDPEEQILFKKTDSVFGDFNNEKQQIEQLFKHVRYYHPSFQPPKIVTLITHLDYQSKITSIDKLLLISLDMYLGKEDEVYVSFPTYLAHNFDKEQLVIDIARDISHKFLIRDGNRRFIDLMIQEGKRMFLLDIYLPHTNDQLKMGYQPKKYDWITANETEVWKYFIENDMIYSTDKELYHRFIAEAPFSKFYTEIDKLSPGGVGVFIGRQIVRDYMAENEDTSVQQMLQTPAEEIFKKSNYKPRK